MGIRLRRIIRAGTFFRLVISIVLSFIIWGFIVWETNPEQKREFTAVTVTARNVPLNMLIAGSIPSVTVTVKGPQDVVRALSSGDIAAYVDFQHANGTGIDEYPVQVETPPGLRRVIVEPLAVDVELDLFVTRTFALTAREDELRPANVTSVDLSTEVVSIQGPQALVSRVVTVEVPIDIGGRRESFVEDVAPVPLSEQGEWVEGVVVSPATVELSVIFETTSKNVRVQVMCACVVDGQLQEIVLEDASAIPSTVEISGPSSALDAVDSIPTVPIDPTVLRESDWILGVELDLSQIPSAVSVRERTIDVWVPVEPLRQPVGDVTIELLNLDSGLTASLAVDTVTVVVTGDLDDVDLLGEGVLTAVVDLAGLAPGAYTLEVRVIVPAGVAYEAIDPRTVQVTIQRAPQPNNQRVLIDGELLESVR